MVDNEEIAASILKHMKRLGGKSGRVTLMPLANLYVRPLATSSAPGSMSFSIQAPNFGIFLWAARCCFAPANYRYLMPWARNLNSPAFLPHHRPWFGLQTPDISYPTEFGSDAVPLIKKLKFDPAIHPAVQQIFGKVS